MNNTLILRRRGFETFQGWQFWFQMFIGMIGFIAVGVMFFFSRETDPFSQSFFYVPFLYLIVVYFHSRFILESKLEIDEFGLSHTSGFPDSLKRFNPDWRISWAEIQKVEHAQSVVAKNSVLLPLNLKLLNKTIKVFPSQWINPEEELKKPCFKFTHDVASMFENSPLVKAFEAKGLLKVTRSKNGKYQSNWVNQTLGTDINSSPISITMAGFVFFSIFYFIVEVYFVLTEFYAGTPPYLYMVLGGVIALVASYLLLINTKFELIEKIILALFVSLSTAAVMYPLMLRVNEWTDTEGLHKYTYTKMGAVKWRHETSHLPASHKLPTLTFDDGLSEYWAQFDMDSTKEFELRKGGLGFYQINVEKIYEEQHAFYKDK